MLLRKSSLFGLLFLLLTPVMSSLQAADKSAEAKLDNVDALKAMAIANDWKWSQPAIKSHVTAKEVVFNFPDGRTRKIPLPKDKMVVAVAPYIQQTHT